MSAKNRPFHPFEGTVKGDYRPARRKLYRALGRRTETQEDWAVLNSDRDRAHEFADYYFSRPQMKGFERALCADLVVESAVDLIEPEPVDELEPVPDDVAAALIRRLLADPYTKYYLDDYVRPELRAVGYYRRIAEIYDRVSGRSQS